MNRPTARTIPRAAIAGLGLSLSLLSPAQDASLAERYRAWLDEEVVYIITPREREVFGKLGSDRERDIFIEAFWRQRDPTPETPVNESRTEHGRRIREADRLFGRSSPRPGWTTDRGRMLIILGAPDDIGRFEGRTEIVPVEVWFYRDRSDLGLPPGFHLVFFQEQGLGDFRLYSPARDGPQALLAGVFGAPDAYRAAYERLREVDPNLAAVSLSLIPGESETGSGRPSVASDSLIQKVEGAPQAKVRDEYARRFLAYKDSIDVEYSANYLESDAVVFVAVDGAGVPVVHYAVEPRRLSVGKEADGYGTTLRVNGILTDPDGAVIHQFEKTFAVRIETERLADLGRRPFLLRDLFPLLPGAYKMSILVRNEVSKEFCSFERALDIPAAGGGLRILRPALGYKSVRTGRQARALRPFQVGPFQVAVQPGRTFSRGDALVAAFQVDGLTAGARAGGLLRFQILREGELVAGSERRLDACAELPDVVEEIPLAGLAPARYDLRIALVVDGREAASLTEGFDLTHGEYVPRPWVQSKLLPGPGDPAFERILGAQLFNAGRARQARSDWAGALAAFEQAMSRSGVNAAVLNAVGECYLQMGRSEDALAAWERSLALDPGQPEIRKKADAIK